jgi:16S rRNA (guanine(966)-N(2))-methyltransferase RsmD
MRVITGQARGRKLISPEGYDVRPTTDKVKESLFNIIQFRLNGATVLDLFAGSGQLGIEALSRGAEKAVFVDSSRKSLDVVKKNIELCRFTSQAQTFLCDAAAFLRTTKEKFDIVILDPPYHKNLCISALELLGDAVDDDAVIICETQSDEELPENVGRFVIDRIYSYSSIKLTAYRVDSEKE